MQLYCKLCENTKDANDFIKRKPKEPDSQKNVRCCRECNRKRNKARYDSNSNVREKSAKATMVWAKRNRDKLKVYHERYEKKFIVKRKAKDAVNYEIRKGRMIRRPCEACKTTKNVHAHHDFYEQEQWLNVRWLCCKHHNKWHSILDPLKEQGEGKKVFDKFFVEFINENATFPA